MCSSAATETSNTDICGTFGTVLGMTCFSYIVWLFNFFYRMLKIPIRHILSKSKKKKKKEKTDE